MHKAVGCSTIALICIKFAFLNPIKLTKLDKDCTAIIRTIADKEYYNQLIQLGFIEGSKIRMIHKSLAEQTLCVEVNQTQFALSRNVAESIDIDILE